MVSARKIRDSRFSSSLATSLDDLSLAFLDVETTGLSPRYGDRICEIAIVRTRVDLVQATFQSLVNPERPISPGAAAVNHLSDADVSDSPLFSEIADTVLKAVGNAIVVCHNAPFDLSFVGTEMQRANKPFGPPIVLDTLQIARRCFSFSSNSLPSVAHIFQIPTPDAHRALGDALTTRLVYLELIEELYKRGMRTLGDLLDAQGGAGYAPVMPDIPLPPTIAEALGSRKRLFLRYVDARGEITERWVTPQEVTGGGDALALIAFCHLREETRQFRLDRIIEMRIE